MRLLIDTGASTLAIDQRIAEELALKSHGVINIATPSSASHTVETFDVDLVLPQLWNTVPGSICHRYVQAIDGLLERDVLQNRLYTAATATSTPLRFKNRATHSP